MTGATFHGPDGEAEAIADLADQVGLPLLPWQRAFLGTYLSSDDRPWFVIVCRECWPEATLKDPVGAQPFRSPVERGQWSAEHRRTTGHESWIVADLPTPR
jgi:hypothetical protein